MTESERALLLAIADILKGSYPILEDLVATVQTEDKPILAEQGRAAVPQPEQPKAAEEQTST